ncbi:MAG TPA: amino acid-binding protein [Holophaga sp.]|jgi:hypothetical protein|nr:amino acid-binding protein [Holophaga sp.]
MHLTQLSVFLENKPGRLEHVLQVLANEQIDIVTLTIAELRDFGILRLIVDRPEAAFAALRREHITSSKTEVLPVAVDIKPGSLLRLLDILSRHEINIEYMYALSGKHESQPIMIFRFEDLAAAREALKEGDCTILSCNTIQNG